MSQTDGGMSLIEKLTPEQEDLIPVIREKWRQIALSTEPINRQKVTQSVNAAYALIGEKEPKLLFFNSPYTALNTVVCLVLNKQLDYELGKEFKGKLENVLWTQLKTQLQSQLDDALRKNYGRH